MVNLKTIKEVITLLENDISFSPDKWVSDPIFNEVVSVTDLSKSFQKDYKMAYYIKKLIDTANAKYKDFSSSALSYYEDNNCKKILSGNEKDLTYTNGSKSITLDEQLWKSKNPKEYADVFSKYQKETLRKGSISWK